MPDYFLKKNLDFKPKRGGRLAVNGMMKYIQNLNFYTCTYCLWYCCIATQHGG